MIGFTWLTHEHASTERMAFNLATELQEWGFPGQYQTGDRVAVPYPHAVHRVGTRYSSTGAAYGAWPISAGTTKAIRPQDLRRLAAPTTT
jgi:hypothetical protein